jgi:hypothetical protein
MQESSESSATNTRSSPGENMHAPKFPSLIASRHTHICERDSSVRSGVFGAVHERRSRCVSSHFQAFSRKMRARIISSEPIHPRDDIIGRGVHFDAREGAVNTRTSKRATLDERALVSRFGTPFRSFKTALSPLPKGKAFV